jgi:hypothetical protein
VAGKEYLTRQAAILLKLARSTKDPQIAAGLVEKATDPRLIAPRIGAPELQTLRCKAASVGVVLVNHSVDMSATE